VLERQNSGKNLTFFSKVNLSMSGRDLTVWFRQCVLARTIS